LEKFEMKKTLVAIAALTLVGAASAQVTLSGGVRAAVQNTGVANAETTVNTNDVAANNVTITAVEDLGGGMKVTGQYNMRNDIMTGEVSASRPATFTNQLWRNSSVAVDASWGQVRAGRFGLNGLYAFDAFGATGIVTAYAGNGIGGRYTNMLQYTTPNVNGLSAQVGVSMDGATANEDASWIYIDYAKGPLALRVLSEKSAALTLAAYAAMGFLPAVTAATAEATQTSGTGVGASYDFGVAKLMGGYASSKSQATSVISGEQYHIGATAPFGAAMGKAGYMKNQTTGVDVMSVGVDYNLSKTALVFADIGKTSNLANATWQVGVHKKF
jgi:predicted porin